MLNLLNQKNKKVVQKEYVLRSIVVFFSLLFVVVSIAVFLLIPSFILSQIKISMVNQKLTTAEKAKSAKKSSLLLATLKNENEKIKALNNQDDIDLVGVIKKIATGLPQGFKIEGFMYNKSIVGKSKEKILTLTIRGIANDRNSLIIFINKLKKDSDLTSINSPVSNLVKDRDINFLISAVIVNKSSKSNFK